MGEMHISAMSFGPGNRPPMVIRRQYGHNDIIGWSFDALTEEEILIELPAFRGRACFLWYAEMGGDGDGVVWAMGDSGPSRDQMSALNAVHVSEWVRVEWKKGIIPVRRKPADASDTLFHDAVLLTVILEGEWL